MKIIFAVVIGLVTIALLSGCIEDQSIPIPTSVPTPTQTIEPTISPTPVPTVTPIPIPTPTPTPPSITYKELEYLKANGEPITLINHRDSTNPTFSELRKFIENDDTNELIYGEFSFHCVDYAEQVHNNAEARGIKAGIVVINFENEPIGHALNVFKTKDKGLVYVDSTGDDYTSTLERITECIIDTDCIECSTDKFAYVKEGKEYGAISINLVDFNTDYEHYEMYRYLAEDYVIDVCSYNERIEEYNVDVINYNVDVSYYNSLPAVFYDDASYDTAMELYYELEERENELDSQGNDLDSNFENLESREKKYGCAWMSLGIVEEIEVYW